MNAPATALELVADIGGTSARFALVDSTVETLAMQMLHAQTLPTAGFASLQHAARHYLQSVDAQPRRGAIAVASPVDADDIHLTNRAWSFNRSELQDALGLDELLLLNDFGAVARAVPWLRATDRIGMYGLETSALRGPISVLGPGTGLGVAQLVGSPAQGWQVVETEGGHATFAPIGAEEHAISRWLIARYGRASNERVLSGNGLAQIDAVLRGGAAVGAPPSPEWRDPAAIVALALAGDDVPARQSLARFCAVLGSVAGDIALIHGARTVMIAGGIVPRFVPFLRSSAFRERFLAKGRFAAYLESVAIHVITHPYPGLLGAAHALRGGGAGAAVVGDRRVGA
jgi:glucokinase